MNIVDQQTFRDAMSCMGAAVNIITTDGPAGRAGFTASAVCSVTDTPPTLLVCLNRGASVWPVFNENRTLCVNTLSAGQEPLSNLFGGKTPMEHRFAAGTAREWSPALLPATSGNELSSLPARFPSANARNGPAGTQQSKHHAQTTGSAVLPRLSASIAGSANRRPTAISSTSGGGCWSPR